jgi:hypothetical protein
MNKPNHTSHEPISEVAHLRQQMSLECEAAWQGLYGIAQGAARHVFIAKKLENMWAHHSTLKQIVGKQEADRVLEEVLEHPQAGK